MRSLPQQILIATFSLVFVGISGWALGSGAGTGRSQSEALYRLWYLFSLVVCITIVAMALAHMIGAFDGSGEPTGKVGKLVLWVFESYADLRFELSLFFCVTFLIITPPSMTYLFTGFFGFASWELLFPETLKFLIYFLLKAFVTFSGIVFIIVPWAYFENWTKLTLSETVCTALASLSLVGYSFFIMFFYKNGHEVVLFLMNNLPPLLLRGATSVHRMFTRNVRQKVP